MVVETLKEAQEIMERRWWDKSDRERREIEDRYALARQGRKYWKKNLKPAIDRMCATHNV